MTAQFRVLNPEFFGAAGRAFRVLSVALGGAVAAGMAAPAAAQGEVRVHALADTVEAGARFEVAVAADHEAGVEVLFADVPRDRVAEGAPLLGLGDAEALDVRRLAPVGRPGGARTDSAVYVVAAFAADSARVGPFPVRFVAGGDTTVVASPTVVVRVRRFVSGPDADPEPVAPPFAFPDPRGVWVTAAVAAGVVLSLLGWALWGAWRRRPGAPPPPPPAPHAEASARLDALAAGVPEAADGAAVQAWYVELSDALRRYLRRRLGVVTRERTTGEIVGALAGRLPDGEAAALRGVLRAADRVKFADFRPGPEASRDALARAREAVDAVEAHEREAEAARRAAEESARAAAEAAP